MNTFRKGLSRKDCGLQQRKAGNVCFVGLGWLVLAVALVQFAASQNPDKLQLVGVGTTAPLPIYLRWFRAFEKTRSDLHVSYMPSGSQAGVETVAAGTTDFGATDAPLTDKQAARAKVVQFATLLMAIVPTYNVAGVQHPLKFSPRVLAGIYLGIITKWNDPAISALNRDEQLPSSTIAVIHSADGRGSGYIWSDYLSKVSVEWRTRIGRGLSVEWPVGVEADGNGNLARMVRETSNSIGFVELAYAVQNQLPCGQVQNAAGNFITADSSSIMAAALAARALPSNVRASITNPPGDRSYPISSFTWILVPGNLEPAKQDAMKDFLRWALNEGQNYAAAAGFTKLPKAIVDQELKTLEGIP